jgi:hypothetical protein
MKHIVVTILLVGVLLPLTSAQQPEVPQWEMDWVDEDEPVLLDLDGNKYFNEYIIFYIENTRPTPIEIFLDVSFDNDDVFDVDVPDSVDVEGGSNVTVQITISGSGIGDDGSMHQADSTFDTLELIGEERIAGTSIGSQQIEKTLQFAPYHKLIPSVDENDIGDLEAGTDEGVIVSVKNDGNSADSVSATSVSISGCPLLDVMGEDSLKGTNIPLGGSVTAELKISAANNHPAKKCTIQITITSEGSGKSSSMNFEIKVDAPEEESNSNSVSNTDNTVQDSDFEIEDNSLPAPSLLACTLMLLIAALIRRN